MAFTIAFVHEQLRSYLEDARNAHDETWDAALQPIASQIRMIEGAKTVDEQKAACAQLSHAILVVQMLHPDRELAKKLDGLRVAIGQFAFMGRADG
jgi:hypothetical protein